MKECFKEARFPENVFRTLLISSDEVKPLVSKDLIDGISLTGSTEAGKKIGTLAGKNIKKSCLGIRGSDPFIVLADADLKLTCETAVKARFQNNGQSCIAAKKIYSRKSIVEEFKIKFLEIIKSQIIGNPIDEKQISDH